MRAVLICLALIAALMVDTPRSLSQDHQIGGKRSLTQGVRRRVPQDFITIQGAIDASANGDTVLVSEGTYFENIRYEGKAIVVASLFLTDGDTAHIERTIIDGSHASQPDSGSVVYFVEGEDTTSVLSGFTVTGGTGTMHFYDFPGAPVWYRLGGGVFCDGSGPKIEWNTITKNTCVGSLSAGGGIIAISQLPSTYLIMEHNKITYNLARGELVTKDWGVKGGGASVRVSARIIGNLVEGNRASGSTTSGGGLIFARMKPFTANPYGVIPSGTICGNVFRRDTSAAREGGGLGGGMEIDCTDDVTLSDNLFEGNLAESSAGHAYGGGLEIVDDAAVYGRKVILQNQFIKNHVRGMEWSTGGGIDLTGVEACVGANEIVGNTVTGSTSCGGGIMVDGSTIRIENNIVRGNSSQTHGGGIEVIDPPLHGTGQAIINNTIYGNSSGVGSGLAVGNQASVVVFNNIFWANSAPVGAPIICIHDKATANVSYCNVEFGYVGEGNIYLDPMFVDGDSLFHLQLNSPCIGIGRDSIQMGQLCYSASASDFDGRVRPMPPGTHVDMGAQEEQITVGVGMKAVDVPTHFALEQNYPNPFNPSTTIRYGLPNRSRVILAVFNTLGQRVALLQSGEQEAGYHEAKFDANGLSSGVYFYRLSAGEFMQTKKLLLVH